ncbi:MAG: hypothetical protein AAB316_23680, partial [Bacteroidota bacterium]
MQKVFTLLFLLFCLSTATAQQLPFRSYTTWEGLLSNVCYFFFQDAQGYLWISTDGGLSRFDGRRFVNYEKAEGGKSIG